MLVSSLLSLALAGSAQALNILLNNDDGFASGNLREVYRLLNEAGHNGLSPITWDLQWQDSNFYSLDCCASHQAERYGW